MYIYTVPRIGRHRDLGLGVGLRLAGRGGRGAGPRAAGLLNLAGADIPEGVPDQKRRIRSILINHSTQNKDRIKFTKRTHWVLPLLRTACWRTI